MGNTITQEQKSFYDNNCFPVIEDLFSPAKPATWRAAVEEAVSNLPAETKHQQ